MSDPKAYSLSRLDAQDEIQYRIIEARRATAKTALLQVIDKQRAKRIARPTVGALSRDFDRQYHDLLESLLIEISTEHRIRFDPKRPAPNRVEIV